MDTSETYIKMCDCPEIQGEWTYKKLGDWVVERDGQRFLMVGHKDMGYGSYFEANRVKGAYRWLPRQNQIQEMMDWKDEYTFWKWDTDTFDGEVAGSYYGQILDDEDLVLGVSRLSMEQVWLVFYMYEKHQRRWDGEKWVSDNQTRGK